jgi:Domain of unknown function (DUF4349)
MPARFRSILRSHPGRLAAGAVGGLLVAGAVVAAAGGGSRHDDRAAKSSAPAAMAMPTTMPFDAADAAAPSTAEGAQMAAGGAGATAAAPAPGASGSSPGAGQAPISPGVGPSGLGGPPVPAAVAAGTARVVKNATLTVSLKNGLGDGYQRAVDAAAGAGGWVQASETGTDQATLTLKVPSDKLEGVVGTIRGLGKVTSVAENGEDVTAEYVDLDARISHWQAQEAVFVGLMAKARTIPETIQIQQQLSTIQEQIEQLDGRRKFLDGQTSYSTIRLNLREEGAAAKPDGGPVPQSTLARAWDRSAGAALAVLGGSLIVLGVVVPLGAVLAVPAWIVAGLVRRRRVPAPAEV